MILKRGITGFFDVQNEPLKELDLKAFKQVCYSARIDSLSLKQVCSPKYTNYYYAHFGNGKKDLYVLLNKIYPIVAFTDSFTFEKRFIDIPESSALFWDYEIPGAVSLNSAFAYNDHELSEAELQQIRYWKPVSVGNIVFNDWD